MLLRATFLCLCYGSSECSSNLAASMLVARLNKALYFQDKENVTTGSHCPTGTAHDCPGTTGNDGTEHHLALALDCCAVKANDGGAGPDLLALGGNVLEPFTFEFDRIEPNLHDKPN